MEYTRVSDFPLYSDGDVAIIVAPAKTYQLHSNVLRTQSHFFAEVLNEDQAATLSSKARKDGVTIRYRYQLVKAQFGAIGTFQRLVSLLYSAQPIVANLCRPACRQLWSLTFSWLLAYRNRQWPYS